MKSLSPRRSMSACVLAAAATAALVAPGAASASLGAHCSGVSIGAQGSSLQKVAQETLWDPGFNTSSDKFACSGSLKPTIKYNPSGSGAGLRSWGAEAKEPSEINFTATNAFVGTDEPPNKHQQEEIISQESTPTEGTLLSIPVAQESVAVIVDLPEGCTATSTAAPGRLVLSDKALQGVFAGTTTKWSEISEGGDTLTPSSCGTDSITPVVRFDQSGTTHIFKRFLGLINTGGLVTSSGTESWDDLSEGGLNVVWPTAANVVKPAAKGGEELIKKVVATPGSIGYVNIAEARVGDSGAFVPPAGGAGTRNFWVEVENGAKGTGAKEKVTYTDPATNGDVAALASANCAKTAYTNGENPFPPPSLTGVWNEVTTSVPTAKAPLKEKDYALCGLTYDLAFTQYHLLEAKGATLEEATTVNNFLGFVADKKGGEAELKGNDYEVLPKAVASKVVTGVATIGF
jgi:ABC-type phosphate transport system substrate-binding protein